MRNEYVDGMEGGGGGGGGGGGVDIYRGMGKVKSLKLW